MDDGYGDACLVGTPRTSRAVGVDGHVVGQPVVDDVSEVVYVKAARRHVGGHEELGDVVAEFLHGQVALRLREVAVEAVGVVAVGYELVGYLLCLALGAAEDDAVDVGVVVGHTLEGEVFVVGLHHIVDVLDVVGAFVLVAGYEFHRILHELAGYAGYLLGHRGREHQHLAVVGHV